MSTFLEISCEAPMYLTSCTASTWVSQDKTCSQFTLSGRRLEEDRPLSPSCAPAMQQCYKLKNERHGDVGVGSEGRQRQGTEDRVNEGGKEKTYWDHCQCKMSAEIMVNNAVRRNYWSKYTRLICEFATNFLRNVLTLQATEIVVPSHTNVTYSLLGHFKHLFSSKWLIF